MGCQGAAGLKKAQDPSGNTELHLALLHADNRKARELLSQMPGLASATNSSGKSPLFIASELGDFDMIAQLWHTLPSYFRGGCLHAAIRNGNLETVKEIMALANNEFERTGSLSEHAAFLYACGNYPIHVAAERGHLEVMKLLLEAFPDLIFLENVQKKNVLHISIENRRTEMTGFLLERKEWESLALAADSDGKTFIDKAEVLEEMDVALLENMIPKKPERGGAKSFISQLETIRNRKASKRRMEDMSTTLEWLSVTAVLLATMSYKGVLSSPGGLNDKGQPLLKDDKNFQAFVLLNIIALYVSFAVVMLLAFTVSRGLRNQDPYLGAGIFHLRFFNVLICVGSFSILGSFERGLKALLHYHVVPLSYVILPFMLALFVVFITTFPQFWRSILWQFKNLKFLFRKIKWPFAS